MKLKTEMVDSLSSEQGHKHVPDKHFASDSFHDAAAAHALIQAMDRVSSQVTFHTMTNRECVSQVLDAVRGTASELMREWGFDSGEVAQ